MISMKQMPELCPDISSKDVVIALLGPYDTYKAALLTDIAHRGQEYTLENLPAVANVLLEAPSLEVVQAACQVLCNAGEHAAPYSTYVVALLQSSDPDIRYEALIALGMIGHAALYAQEEVAGLLNDESDSVKTAACSTLGLIGAESKVPELTSMLEDLTPEVVGAACFALGQLGEAGASAAKEVASKLEEPRSRAGALHALGAMKADAFEYGCDVANCLGDEDADVRVLAAQLIGQMGEAFVTSDGFNVLKSFIEHTDGRYRCAACLAISLLGECAASEASMIANLVDDPFEEPVVTELTLGGAQGRVDASVRKVRCAAAVALGSLGPAGVDNGSRIARLLDSQDYETRLAACEAFALMGEEGKEFSPKVVALLEDPQPAVRARAAHACGKLQDGDACNDLADLIQDKAPSVREEAILAIAGLGEDGWEHIEKIFGKTSDYNPHVRAAALKALGKMDERGQAYAGVVAMKLLEHEAVIVRVAALESLGCMGCFGAAFAEEVAACLDDTSPEVQAKACYALGEFGEEADPYRSLLVEMCEHQIKQVRQAASKAVNRLKELS